jgi:hypothetical protein
MGDVTFKGQKTSAYKENVDHLEKWHIWEDNIKMDLKEEGRKGVDWIHLVQDRD